MDKDFKKFLKGRSNIIIIGLRSRKIRELSRLPKNYGAYKRSSLLRLLTDKALWYLLYLSQGSAPHFTVTGMIQWGKNRG